MQTSEKAPQGVGSRKGNKVTITRRKGHPVYKWRALYVDNGKGREKGFKTKKAAEEWAEDREEEALAHGTGTTLTHAERSTVIETRHELESLGVDLRAAVEFALDHFKRAQKSCTVSELRERVIHEKERSGLSERYIQDLRSRLGRFDQEFGNRIVSTVSRDEISDWLHDLKDLKTGQKLSATSLNNFRRVLVVMFNEAQDGGFIEENPAEKVKQSKVIESEVGILTPEETARVLEVCPECLLPAVAIGIFAGVRRSELEELEWADIDLENKLIRIRAKNAKSSRNRQIRIEDNLLDWISPSYQREGRIWPSNGRKLLDKTHRLAGFGEPGTETEKQRKAGIRFVRPWPENALRHSYASYWLERFKDANQLALFMGHRGTDIIFSNYRALVKPKHAETFWQIRPSQPRNVVAIA